MTIVRLFFAMTVICHWPLHQLDIKNVFLHGDLEEECKLCCSSMVSSNHHVLGMKNVAIAKPLG